LAQQKTPRARGRPAGTKPESDGGKWLFYGIAAVIVVAGMAWLLVARDRGIGQSAALPTPEEFQALAQEVDADSSVGISAGPETAPVELVEFADYSCPHCATFAGFAGKLLRQNYVETANAPVHWVMYDYVLGNFPNSVPAAIAARCAGDQGRYWPMHDLLFSRQNAWWSSGAPNQVFDDLAQQVGLDMEAYRECVADGRHLREVVASRKYGDQLGVSSTPTLFLNGRRLDLGGKEPYSYIEGLIKAELEAAAGKDSSEGGP